MAKEGLDHFLHIASREAGIGLEHLRVDPRDPARVLGHLWMSGCEVALRFAARNPEKVEDAIDWINGVLREAYPEEGPLEIREREFLEDLEKLRDGG